MQWRHAENTESLSISASRTKHSIRDFDISRNLVRNLVRDFVVIDESNKDCIYK